MHLFFSFDVNLRRIRAAKESSYPECLQEASTRVKMENPPFFTYFVILHFGCPGWRQFNSTYTVNIHGCSNNVFACANKVIYTINSKAVLLQVIPLHLQRNWAAFNAFYTNFNCIWSNVFCSPVTYLLITGYTSAMWRSFSLYTGWFPHIASVSYCLKAMATVTFDSTGDKSGVGVVSWE